MSFIIPNFRWGWLNRAGYTVGTTGIKPFSSYVPNRLDIYELLNRQSSRIERQELAGLSGNFEQYFHQKSKLGIVRPRSIRVYTVCTVCTERKIDRPQFVYNKIFLKKLLQKLVNHIFTLLVAPFASKQANFCKRFFQKYFVVHELCRLSNILRV